MSAGSRRLHSFHKRLKNEQPGLLQLKIICIKFFLNRRITIVKNSVNRHNKLDTAKGKISELEDRFGRKT